VPTNAGLLRPDVIDRLAETGVATFNFAVDVIEEKPGLASVRAALRLKRHGLTRLHALQGGFSGWQALGFPVETPLSRVARAQAACPSSGGPPNSRQSQAGNRHPRMLTAQCFQTDESRVQRQAGCLPSVAGDKHQTDYRGRQENMTGDTFEALLAPNLPSVRRFVQTRLRTSDHADDVIQQTLLQAFAHRDTLRASSKFKSWLCSIAMNQIRMFFRTGRPTVSLHDFPQIESRDSGPSPLARVEELERLEWLRAGMDRLSDRDRKTIRLRDLEGMTLTETAEAFELTKSAAKATHFRARRRLACALRSMEPRQEGGKARTSWVSQ
jgi:RNA polymerase sigma-70 factor (ECF subfamily)